MIVSLCFFLFVLDLKMVVFLRVCPTTHPKGGANSKKDEPSIYIYIWLPGGPAALSQCILSNLAQAVILWYYTPKPKDYGPPGSELLRYGG